MTWFVTDMQEYVAARRELGAAYREVIGAHYPAMSVYGTTGLLNPDAKLEVEVTAVVPD
jgi:enamine deaminase RidA (YjgF/YER057c/UK114 family)